MNPARVAELSLVGIAAIWGVTFVMVQDAVAVLPVMAFLAYRFIPAAALIGIIFRKELRLLSREGWRVGLLMGVFLTAGYIFQTLGLEHTTASNDGFITGMFVVLTPLFGALFLGHKAGRVAWMAAGVATLGLYLLSAGGDLSGSSGRTGLLGDGLVLLCACSFAGHILVTDVGVAKHHAGALLAVQLGVCGAFTGLMAAAGGQLEVPREGVVWSALIVTSLFASALGFFVQTYAQKHAPPARTALILASEPAFAGLFAFLLAGERLTALDWLGAVLILGAIISLEIVPYVRRTPLDSV